VESFEGVNLVAEIDAAAGESRPLFIVTAHVDSRSGTPGADDNASAVACLLELARLLRPEADDSPVRLRLIATDLEECGMLGAAHHARGLRVDGAALMGMVSLEMLGYRDPTPGSQQMPKALEGLYPDTGDFIGVVGNERSAGLLTRFATAMKCSPTPRSSGTHTITCPATPRKRSTTNSSPPSLKGWPRQSGTFWAADPFIPAFSV
jgi:Zn-dependent M28 family amino/carboxypeptidase